MIWNPFRKQRRAAGEPVAAAVAPEPTAAAAPEPTAAAAPEPTAAAAPEPTVTAPPAPPTAAPAPGNVPQRSAADIELHVVDTLRLIYDPEIPVNIYDLGLVYDVKVEATGNVAVVMTLTSPACPVAGSLPGEVEDHIRALPGVTGVTVDITWDPPWGPEKMSEAARLQLNL